MRKDAKGIVKCAAFVFKGGPQTISMLGWAKGRMIYIYSSSATLDCAGSGPLEKLQQDGMGFDTIRSNNQGKGYYIHRYCD